MLCGGFLAKTATVGSFRSASRTPRKSRLWPTRARRSPQPSGTDRSPNRSSDPAEGARATLAPSSFRGGLLIVSIPIGITREDVLAALARIPGGGTVSPFGESRDYDLVESGVRYAPKAVVGLAARRVNGGVD